MKYLAGIIIALFLFINLSFSDNQFTIYVNILLFGLFYLVVFLSEYSAFDKKVESDFEIRSQKKFPKVYYLFLLIFLTILIYTNSYKTPSKILFILFIWTTLILEIVFFFLYQKKKPFTLFIKNNELTLFDKSFQKRDIVGLNRILFDRFNKKFEFRFDKGYKLKINSRDYKKEDIDELLDIVIKKSKHPIFIPNNYKAEKLIKES